MFSKPPAEQFYYYYKELHCTKYRYAFGLRIVDGTLFIKLKYMLSKRSENNYLVKDCWEFKEGGFFFVITTSQQQQRFAFRDEDGEVHSMLSQLDSCLNSFPIWFPCIFLRTSYNKLLCMFIDSVIYYYLAWICWDVCKIVGNWFHYLLTLFIYLILLLCFDCSFPLAGLRVVCIK